MSIFLLFNYNYKSLNEKSNLINNNLIKLENSDISFENDHNNCDISNNKQNSLINAENSILGILNWAKNIKQKLFKISNESDTKLTISEYNNQFSKFVAAWNHMIILVVRELTLQGTNVFGLIHILHLLLFEYIIFLMEDDVFQKFQILPLQLYTKV